MFVNFIFLTLLKLLEVRDYFQHYSCISYFGTLYNLINQGHLFSNTVSELMNQQGDHFKFTFLTPCLLPLRVFSFFRVESRNLHFYNILVIKIFITFFKTFFKHLTLTPTALASKNSEFCDNDYYIVIEPHLLVKMKKNVG